MTIGELGRRLIFLLRRGRKSGELDEEMRLHLELRAARYREGGIPEEEAGYAARRRFGNTAALQERSRETWGFAWVEVLTQDIRFALRQLRRSPGFALVAILTLGLGIGVNTAVFSLLATFFRPVPVRDAKTVVSLWWTRGGEAVRSRFTYDNFRALHDRTRSYSGLVASGGVEPVVLGSASGDVLAQKVYAEFVSDGFFGTLGGRPEIGRTLASGDNAAPGGSAVMVLSHRFWVTRFGGDSEVVGRTLLVNGQPLQVVGVASDGFVGEGHEFRGPQLWIPLMMRGALAQAGTEWFDGSRKDWLVLTGRLGAGHTLASARAELAVLAGSGGGIHSVADSTTELGVYQATGFSPQSIGDLATVIAIGMLAPLLVLLVACANLVNLLLSRAAARQKEIGVRLAIGAGRGRLVRQLLVESSLLAALGGAVALALVWSCTRAFAVGAAAAFGSRDPVTAAASLGLGGPVLGVTALVCCATALLCGLVPALRATRPDLVTTLKAEGGARFGLKVTRSRIRGGLVVAQVAASLVLLLAAGVLLRAMLGVAKLDTGMDVEHALVVDLRPSLVGYDSARADGFEEQLVDRLLTAPGIQAAGRAQIAPFEGNARATVSAIGANGSAGITAIFSYNMVTPGFFEAAGLHLVRGRVFSENERRAGAPLIVVGETMAKTLWPGEDAVGKLVRWRDNGSKGDITKSAPVAEVAGVVGDALEARLGEDVLVSMYTPLSARGGGWGDDPVVIARTAGNPQSAVAATAGVVRSLDPRVWASAYPMQAALLGSEAFTTGRSLSLASTALGLLALLLAAVGLYGVMSFGVTQRTRELGIRAALGASRAKVFRNVLGQGMRLVAIGVLFGLLGGAVAARALAALLVGVKAFDVVAFLGVPLFLLAIAFLAAYVPARRATRIDPAVALRGE